MPADVSYLAAFLVGLMGGVHCVGMCAGIVAALSAASRTEGQAATPLRLHLAYNAGRLTSYTLAGALMGGVGALATHLTEVNTAQTVLQVLAGGFMIALGLYLGRWWTGLVRVETAGGAIWRLVEPLGRGLIPVHAPAPAFALGMVWGWLPCGLVYSVLVWCISSGNAASGALLMLSFGAGTLPTLLTLGAAASATLRALQSPPARRIAGALVLAFGLYTLWLALR
jgi:sulfite exporter TauE/SafE